MDQYVFVMIEPTEKGLLLFVSKCYWPVVILYSLKLLYKGVINSDNQFYAMLWFLIIKITGG